MQTDLEKPFMFLGAVLLVVVFVLSAFFGCRDYMQEKLDTQIEQSEQTIESYEKEISEYRSLLDEAEDENAQLSATITELQDALTGLQSDLEAFKDEHTNCRPPIGYSYDNALLPSNLTVEELSSGLLYELKPHAHCFIEAEEKYGVNAIVLASIAALESGWGRSSVAISHNNLFGYTSPNGGYREFTSIEECIDTVARHLKRNYLTEGGSFYNGVSLGGINIMYCAQRNWSEKVNSIAIRLIERINNV